MSRYVTVGQLTDALLTLYDHVNQRIETMADATQADIDNLTSQVAQVATDLTAAQSKLQAEIDSLHGAGVDVTNLQAAVAPLDAAVVALGNLQPSPAPTPPPAA